MKIFQKSIFYFTNNVLWLFLVTASGFAFSQNMTRSESIFGGFELINEKNQWPKTLELPIEWTKGLLELAKYTSETNLEQAACLSIDAIQQVSTDSSQAIIEYQVLLNNEATMPAAKFASESERLRNIIEGKISNNTKNNPIWRVGRRQGGFSQSVHSKVDVDFCDGAVRGRIHTHPENFEFTTLSDADLIGALKKPRSQFTGVINKRGSTCLAFSGHDPKKLTNIELSEVSKNVIKSILANTYGAPFQDAKKQDFSSRILNFRRIAANILSKYNGALYCGSTPEKLEIVNPTIEKYATSEHATILISKALIIIAKRFYHTDMTEINFPFTPELDSKFHGYLMRNIKKINQISQNDLGSILKETGEEKFDKLAFISLLLNQNNEFGILEGGNAGELTSPDIRDEENRSKINLAYAISAGGTFSVSMYKFRNNIGYAQANNEVPKIVKIASWSKKEWFLYTPEENKFSYNDNFNRIFINGNGKTNLDGFYIPHGTAEYESERVKLIGQFVDGKLQNVLNAEIYDKRAQQWISTRDFANRYPGEGY